jgi:ribose 5-phosphate isomerase B
MRIAVAADHAGAPLLAVVSGAVRAAGHEVFQVGEPVDGDDYPDVARQLAEAVVDGDAERGVLVCGSGAGVAVAANKVRGIRASMAHDTYTARQMVEHDDVNVLAMGARVIGPELAAAVTDAFVRAEFTHEERHRRRVAKVIEMEKNGR